MSAVTTGMFTFDPVFPDGSPRRLAGTHRPPWDYDTLAARYPYFGATYVDRVRKHWETGGFDVPIYHNDERAVT